MYVLGPILYVMDPSLAQGYFETSYQFSYQYNLGTKKRDWATKKYIM